jgi:hypothetical protein
MACVSASLDQRARLEVEASHRVGTSVRSWGAAEEAMIRVLPVDDQAIVRGAACGAQRVSNVEWLASAMANRRCARWRRYT